MTISELPSLATSDVCTVAELEARIGKTPAQMNLKVIDHLDPGAIRWMGACPLVHIAFGNANGIAITMGGGEPGFISADATHFRISAAALDDPNLAQAGRRVGSLIPLPGIVETLRANGFVEAVENGQVVVKVTECYGHCGKSLLRADFWTAEPIEIPHPDVGVLIAASRFMALASMNADGSADVSPKGDPAGSLARIVNGALCFADRPGNRRVDSFRNILTRPQVSATLLVPGSTAVLSVSGTARISDDTQLRESFAVQGKTPHLVTRIEKPLIEVRTSGALVKAKLWPVRQRPDGIDPIRIFVDHVKQNKSIAAKLTGAVMSVPGLLQRGLENDYKKNLY